MAGVGKPIKVAILGSTGSIGTQALDIISRNPDRFELVGLAAGGANINLLAEQVIAFGPRAVGIAAASAASDLQLLLYAHAQAHGFATGSGDLPELLAGPDAASRVASMECDVVLNGMAGAAGLEPTLAALVAGNRVALANKESLIIGGPLVRALSSPGQIVPVDSEHSALAQALRGESAKDIDRLILTASGGPFRGWTREQLASVTPQQALAHPTWSMGPLVTINSATMVNKGLELIEAHLLFDIPLDRIDVVVHPQSVVHSMVQFVDGSTMVQASPPDMRIPIALGLGWPDRVPQAAPPCDWTTPVSWDFFPLDQDAFPAVGLAQRAGAAGGTAPAVFNGADEKCVAAFLGGQIPFTAIVEIIRRVLDEHLDDEHLDGNNVSLADVLAADSWARERAHMMVSGE
ncbi:MAG: 1-deoxy-D-xylulose-5-phosphate reductoisomerase [Candidatus Nanopelagicales bacterium]|nr:1-deoxy-D-xylulose-5-phosphate reductoisomerase [Candidatus Nanopelagicales bacterium]